MIRLCLHTLILIASLLVNPASVYSAPVQPSRTLSNDRFGEIQIDTPGASVVRTILFFSDQSPEALLIVKELRRRGFLVATIDSSHYLSSIRSDNGTCTYLAGEIERLSQTIQSESGVSHYESPVLLGVRDGAALALAILAQSPNTFLGAITLSFCPSLPLKTPLCKGTSLLSTALPEKFSVSVGLSEILPRQWNDFEFGQFTQCPDSAIESLVKKTPNSQLFPVEVSLARAIREEEWLSRFIYTVRTIGRTVDENSGDAPPLDDLPLVMVRPEKILSPYFVIFISGDGGWAWIDQGIASVLKERGIPVIGLNALKYFWKEKGPQQLSQDISRIITAYRREFGVEKVVLAGYSMGAEVIPIGFNGLSLEAKKNVISLGLVAPGTTSDFEVHIGDWLGIGDSVGEMPILPELVKITNVPVTCITGDGPDEASVCKEASQPNIAAKLLKGGHHFDGDYAAVGAALLTNLPFYPPPSPAKQ